MAIFSPYRFTMKINIAIADDHRIFRKSFIRFLHDTADIKVVIEASNGADLLEQLTASDKKPDLILLDIQMPVMNGIQCLTHLKDKFADIPVIILSQLFAEQYLKKAMLLGVCGYFTKDADPDEVIAAIQKHRQGVFLYEKSLEDEVLKLSDAKELSYENNKEKADFSKRELEIIYWTYQELTSKAIADKLNISTRTVDSHKDKLLKKTGCRSFLGVVVLAMELHLLIKENFE